MWHIVVPGTETRVSLPPTIMQKVRAQYGGQGLNLFFLQGREPRFGYEQWSYSDLYINAYTSFTAFGMGLFVQP